MKVLLVSTYDTSGGAARAAYRLHRTLLNEGVDSRMLVQSKNGHDYTVIRAKPMDTVDKIKRRFLTYWESLQLDRYKDRTKSLFSPAILHLPGLADNINQLNPDIVHLHWVNHGMMQPEDLIKINAPIVWSLHDMWPFTGGCHYDENCGKYTTGCGQCPVLGSDKESDLSTKVFSRKLKSYQATNSLTIVGKSKWIAGCAESSLLFSETKVVNLPNAIDTESFKPFDKIKARELLNLPQEKKLILFGAMGGTSTRRKGFPELAQALSQLDSDDAELVVFGGDEPEEPQGFKHKAHYSGRIRDHIILRLHYCAADVMIVPSIQENLSNAIIESLACGIPVVGFDIGGNSDMIEHKSNGYLAKPFDKNDLAKGINWVLYESDYEKLSHNARQKVLNCFEQKLVANKYLDLYKEILNRRKT